MIKVQVWHGATLLTQFNAPENEMNFTWSLDYPTPFDRITVLQFPTVVVASTTQSTPQTKEELAEQLLELVAQFSEDHKWDDCND